MPGSGVELPDPAGSPGQVGVIEPQGHSVFFRLCEEPAESQRFFEEVEGDVERLLPLLDPKRYLPAAQARTDVIVAARAEWIKRSACSRLPATATTIEGRSMPSASRPSNCRLG
jgi:hypothetical protein